MRGRSLNIETMVNRPEIDILTSCIPDVTFLPTMSVWVFVCVYICNTCISIKVGHSKLS